MLLISATILATTRHRARSDSESKLITKKETKIQEEHFMVRKEFLNGVVVALLLAACLVIQPAQAKGTADNSKGKQKVNKVTAQSDYYAPMDINTIFNYYSNVGDGSFNPYKSDNEGFEFPKGSNVGTCIFEDGLVWTAFKNDTLYCGGSTYNHGLQAGRILQDGTASSLPVADDPTKDEYRIYRVRPDIKPTSDQAAIAKETNLLNQSEVPYINRPNITQPSTGPVTASGLMQQYWDDWNQWPALEGAPFTDANGVAHLSGGPGYDPTTCTPGFPGADQTEWMVMNDVSTSATNGLYGSNPIGIEVQRTIWAYNRTGALGSTIFVSYKFINRSGVKLDTMYVSQWADPDLGFAGDDATGCDTTRSLGYVYNGQATDANFASLGEAPPSAGFDFFQGPIVPGAPTDTAIFNMQKVAGRKNLPMTAFTFFINGNTTFGDPNLTSNGPNGTPQWYNLMRGLVSTTGQPFPASVTGGSKFCYPGDPVSSTGPTFIGQGKVSPPADVRMALCSGPFSMAPGDTQQVVVAAVAAQGTSYLSSVSYLKYYDDIAQTAYNYFFNLPSAPPPPQVNVAQLDGQIVLSWGDSASNAVEEHFSDKGYAFQGYNVWQLPTNSPNNAKLLATYDLVTSQGIITDFTFDPITGFVIPKPVQFGTHSGLQHSIIITEDAFTNTPIVNDRDYYFAVTAYSYNGTGVEPNNLESPISGNIIDARAQVTPPGVVAPSFGSYSNVTHVGTSDGAVSVNVVDPSLVTGNQYQVSFHNETYSLGADDQWTDVTAASKAKRAGKPQDLTGSSVSVAASWNEATKGNVDIHFTADVVSPNQDFCDGISLKFPAGIIIDTTYSPTSNNTGASIPFYLDRTTNTIFYGDSAVLSSDTTKRTGNGIFAGGEDIHVVVHPATVPMIINYTMYDDNFGATYVDSAQGYPTGRLVDVTSADTVSTIANKIIIQHQWNVTDLTAGSLVLQNQTIYNGADIYDQGTYFKANGLYGPGGSSGTLARNIGVAPAVFNGLSVSVNGSFAAPTKIGSITLNGSSVTGSGGEYVGGGFDISDFTIFGFADGTAAGSLPSYGGAGGVPSSDINDLQQGYELKWTGVLGDTTINGKTVVITKSGGSIATLFGASNYSIANHPLNPNPGTKAPFTIRIPFEVWNTDKNEQVNLLVYDRNAKKLDPATADTFSVWRTNDRMYVWVVNTKYTPTVIAPTSSIVADSATWNWVFFASAFKTGDDIRIHYNKPLQIGKDTYTFTIPKVTYSADSAKQSIAKINVFPNPYFGFNKLEADKYDRWVRFTHLPSTNVTIRIFNLAGILVRTLVKPASNSTQFMDWNLLNENQLPVASGMYIAFIDCGPLGTKTLKLAVIPEQQFLDHY
jgi:hypothetical protein